MGIDLWHNPPQEDDEQGNTERFTKVSEAISYILLSYDFLCEGREVDSENAMKIAFLKLGRAGFSDEDILAQRDEFRKQFKPAKRRWRRSDWT